LVGKPEEKRPLGRPRRRWEDRMDLREIGRKVVDWIHRAENRDHWWAVVNIVTNVQIS